MAEPWPTDERTGPQRAPRLTTEPDWLCDGAFLDEFGRLWLCGRIKHPLEQRHQASVFTGANGSGGDVEWSHRLEWFDR